MSHSLLSFIKNWTLPVAIAVGTVFYLLFASVPILDGAASVLGPVCETIFPVSVFATLFVTFAKVDFHLMRLRRWHAAVLAAQLAYTALLVGAILWAGDGPLRLLLCAVLTRVIAP